MPSELRPASEIVRDTKRLLRWAAGILRREIPSPEQDEARSRELRRVSGELETRTERLQRARARVNDLKGKLGKARDRAARQSLQLEKNRCRIEELKESFITQRTPENGVDLENMIWILGTTRTGSTWLGSMMGDLKEHTLWDEPMVGRLFGQFYNSARPEDHLGQRGDPNFIMGDATRGGWVRSVRNFILDGARNCNPMLDRDQYLVIEEPNGSVGAPLLMEALPESRMIFLIRDPRDVVASRLDAVKKGSWLYEREAQVREGKPSLADTKPDRLVRERAKIYALQVGKTREAYEAHGGRKVLVSYEDLCSDTLGEMKRIYSELEIAVDEPDLRRVVAEHSWEKLPQDQKGEGKFFRKGQPGSWREDLIPSPGKEAASHAAPGHQW
jgi:hypothetical protein